MPRHSSSISKAEKFYDFINGLFFNIPTGKPHPLVFDFVKQIFPAFTRKIKPGGWTMYPPNFPSLKESTIHSLIFKKHPYFDANILEGRLEISLNNYSNGSRGLEDLRIWFSFQTKQDADLALKTLSKKFDSLSKKKSLEKMGNKKLLHYSAHDPLQDSNPIEILLTKDELYTRRYKIMIKFGRNTLKDYGA